MRTNMKMKVRRKRERDRRGDQEGKERGIAKDNGDGKEKEDTIKR